MAGIKDSFTNKKEFKNILLNKYKSYIDTKDYNISFEEFLVTLLYDNYSKLKQK